MEREVAVSWNKGKLQSGKLFIIEVAKFSHCEHAPQHTPLPKNQLLFQEIRLFFLSVPYMDEARFRGWKDSRPKTEPGGAGPRRRGHIKRRP